MHNDLIIAELDGGIGCVWKGKNLLVSNIALKYILPKQLKNSHQDISKYVVAKYVYFTKNNNALKHRYKTVDFPDDNVLYVSRRDEINGMLCP